MIKKKNKFFTLVFSMMLGAGQMYMGFMKQGISIMSAAAAIIFLGSWLNIGPILYALPVLWFYSFFDTINKMSLSEEKLQEIEDQYLFIQNTEKVQIKKIFLKYDTIIASLLILVGVLVLGDNMMDYIIQITPNLYPRMHSFMMTLRWDAPRILFAIMIIAIGIKMILGKKTELDSESSEIKEKESDENA